jgi:DNA-binding PadR family transcriptional regulator
LINKFCDPKYSCSFTDSQIIKKILNQLKELNLISSNWSDEKNNLFWELTPIGKKTKNDMLLIKNENIN